MKKSAIIILFIFVSITTFSQVNMFGYETQVIEKEYFFAIRLLPNLNGSLVQVAIKRNESSENEEVEYLTLNSWARQFAGYETSKANPERKNLIENNNIFEVPPQVKNISDEEVEYYTVKKIESILNNLWRLKYSEYPFFNSEKNDEKGWAKHSDEKITWLPSESQMNILRTYGIIELGDFIEGEQAIRLLKDVRNRNWQNRYIQSGGAYQYQYINDTIPRN